MLPVPLHRAIRAALFAVVCVGVGAALHGAVDGCAVPWWAIGLALPLAWLAALPGLGRERSGPVLTAGLGVAQVGLHFLFALCCPAVSTAAQATTAADSAAASMANMPGMSGMSAMAASTHSQHVTHSSVLAMLAAHAIAVVISGWWLRQGERDFLDLCRAAATIVAAPLHELAAAAAALIAAAHHLAALAMGPDDALHGFLGQPHGGLRRRRTPLLTSVTFRGPPTAVAA